MKQVILTILFATLSVASACGDDPMISPDLTKIRIKERPSEILNYVGKIGRDFDTALDSLRKRKNISSEIQKEPLEVIFDYDDRLFYGIAYGECAMYSDVLDTKGNYYLRTWYSSDDNIPTAIHPVRTSIGKNHSFYNKYFDLSGRCVGLTPSSQKGKEGSSLIFKKGIYVKDGRKVVK